MRRRPNDGPDLARVATVMFERHGIGILHRSQWASARRG